jgi:hypothetical protein
LKGEFIAYDFILVGFSIKPLAAHWTCGGFLKPLFLANMTQDVTALQNVGSQVEAHATLDLVILLHV